MKKSRILIPFIFLFAFAILLVQYGCQESNLDIQPNTVTEAGYFQEEMDFQRGVIGVYAKLTDLYWFNNNSPIHGVWQLPGDDITTTGASAFEIFTTLQPAQGNLLTYYRVSYQLISRANIVLEKIEAERDIYVTPGLKEQHKGEALFLRGLTYFNLWNLYGTSPLILERIGLDQPDKLQPTNAGTYDLLDQAILDLETAAGLLPVSWPDSDLGRATANSANGLLGKALVFRATAKQANEDYQAAIVAFNKISGVQLSADFTDNFNAEKENNQESLFEFQASQPATDNVWLANDFEQGGVGSTSTYWGWYENHWSLFGQPPYIGTEKLLNAFESGDPRQPVTVDSATLAIQKYWTKDKKTNTGVASANNPRILRYADILLLQAEALVSGGGNLSEAIDLINQIRTRARGMVEGGTIPANYSNAELDRNKVMEWLRNERLLELAGEEGHRWFDLRRWHLGEQINLEQWDFSSVRTDFSFSVEKNLFYPIPQSEIDLNQNMEQNPGY